MKTRHSAAVLNDFETRSVVLFAALVIGDWVLSSQAPAAPASRGDMLSSSSATMRVASKPSLSHAAVSSSPVDAAERAPRTRAARRAIGQRVPRGGAVALAIAQMESGQLQGFVPFERPARS